MTNVSVGRPFLCPREIVRESENALHLRADSGSTFAELRVLNRSYPHRGEDLTFEKSRNSAGTSEIRLIEFWRQLDAHFKLGPSGRLQD